MAQLWEGSGVSCDDALESVKFGAGREEQQQLRLIWGCRTWLHLKPSLSGTATSLGTQGRQKDGSLIEESGLY